MECSMHQIDLSQSDNKTVHLFMLLKARVKLSDPTQTGQNGIWMEVGSSYKNGHGGTLGPYIRMYP